MCFRTITYSPQSSPPPSPLHAHPEEDSHFTKCFATALRVASMIIGIIALVVYVATMHEKARISLALAAIVYVISYMIDPPANASLPPALPAVASTHNLFTSQPPPTPASNPDLLVRSAPTVIIAPIARHASPQQSAQQVPQVPSSAATPFTKITSPTIRVPASPTSPPPLHIEPVAAAPEGSPHSTPPTVSPEDSTDMPPPPPRAPVVKRSQTNTARASSRRARTKLREKPTEKTSTQQSTTPRPMSAPNT